MRPAQFGYPHIPHILRLWKFCPVVNTENVMRFWWSLSWFFVVFCHGSHTLLSPPLDHRGPSDHRWVAIADFLQDMMFRRDHIVVLRQSLGRLKLQSLDEWCPLFVKDGWKHPSLDFGTLSSSHLMLSGLWNCILQIWKLIGKNSTPWYFHEFHSVLWTVETDKSNKSCVSSARLCQITKGFYLVSSNLAG